MELRDIDRISWVGQIVNVDCSVERAFPLEHVRVNAFDQCPPSGFNTGKRGNEQRCGSEKESERIVSGLRGILVKQVARQITNARANG